MNTTNPYTENVSKKRENFVPLKENSENGNLEKFITLVEHLALTLPRDDDDR